MAANNLRVVYNNRITAIGGSATTNSMNDYKSQSDTGSSFTITTNPVAGSIAVTALLTEITGPVTMTVTGQTALVETTSSSFNTLASGYGGGKYVTKYFNLNTATTSSVNWTATTNSVVVSNAAGAQRQAFLELYTWSKTIPTLFPSGSSTYTWADGTFTLPSNLNGWSRSPVTAEPGQTLWAISITAVDATAVATSVVIWNSSSPYSTGYTDTAGLIGARVAVLDRYKWGTTPPVTSPSGTSTYTWSTGQHTDPATTNAWTAIPGTSIASNNLYIIRQIYVDTATSFTVAFSSSVKVSKFIIGNYWSPKYNTGYGVSLGYDDTTSYERTQAGDLYATVGPRNKTLKFDLQYMDDSDKFQLFDIFKSIGKSKPLFVSVFPQDLDQQKEQMYSIYGRLSSISEIAHTMYSMYSSSLQLEEI